MRDIEDVEVQHPDLDWARQVMIDAKGDRVTDAELKTLRWDHLMGCYLIEWKNMVLGIETDKHIHS